MIFFLKKTPSNGILVPERPSRLVQGAVEGGGLGNRADLRGPSCHTPPLCLNFFVAFSLDKRTMLNPSPKACGPPP